MFAYCLNNPVMGYDPTGHRDSGWRNQAVIGTAVVIIGLALLLAPPTGGASLGLLTLSASAMTAIGGTAVVVGTAVVGDAVTKATVHNAKKSRQSDKERSTQHPSWVSQGDIDLNKSAQQNATELLNNKYGEGKWEKGPSSDFNKIVKWINRSLKIVALITTEMSREERM